MPILYLATLFGPSLAGLFMTALVEGKSGLNSLLTQLRRWRVAGRWYAAALVTAPLLITTLLCILSRTSPAFIPTLAAAEKKTSLLLTGIVMGLVVGFFEELGWTGFAIPRMRQKLNPITTGIILGLFWGLWHLPLFAGSVRLSGSVPPAVYLCILLFSFLPAYRVLMVWVYEHTGSLLLAVLMHAPLAAGQLILIPVELAGTQLVIYDLAFAAILWGIVAVAAIFSGIRCVNQLSY